MNHQLISVVIICYNGEQFLAEAIDSVIAQTYDNWELFLVDDGSSDRSVVIMQEYVAKYPDKIYYLQHPNHQNRGQNASRNLGITHAKGEYIALLDCDDVWLPHKLERQVELMEQHPEAMMIDGQAFRWYSWTGKAEDIEQDKLYSMDFELNTVVYPPQLMFELLEGNYYSVPSIPLLRREVFERVGLYDADYRDWCEDYDFTAKVFYCLPVFVSDEYWSKYRQHPNSYMAGLRSAIEQDKIWLYKRKLRWFESVKDHITQQEIVHQEAHDYLDLKISWYKKRVRLFGYIPLLSFLYNKLYFISLDFLEIVISIGRRLLPFTLRDWLWEKVGKLLYREYV